MRHNRRDNLRVQMFSGAHLNAFAAMRTAAVYYLCARRVRSEHTQNHRHVDGYQWKASGKPDRRQHCYNSSRLEQKAIQALQKAIQALPCHVCGRHARE